MQQPQLQDGLDNSFDLRPMTEADSAEYAKLLHRSFNAWYAARGWPQDYFSCTPRDVEIFFQVYNDLSPGCSFTAVHRHSGELMGGCFYHPRETHMSLGIMAVSPYYFGHGVGRALVDAITEECRKQSYDSLRLVGSAMNMDSFSLYNRSGFVPRDSFNDMVVPVPAAGIGKTVRGRNRVRPARRDDIGEMTRIEEAVSGLRRKRDYAYAIENQRGLFRLSVYENNDGGLDGFLMSCRHPALNMIGPGVARTQGIALALIMAELDRFRGMSPLILIPMRKRKIVEALYGLGGRNVETHLLQVRGSFRATRGVNIPSFLPETG